ncbi:hypothetical protein P7K49_023495 [Saguinus oedipus]|uniref:Uncharacterized protein n=1 Tax=Saguinus oedipus TaxID=9490 RepID=A0ABQ9ULW4_SAGOE|nr:hypothetical protein P7K49_023495 [Saguinus oedipus]
MMRAHYGHACKACIEHRKVKTGFRQTQSHFPKVHGQRALSAVSETEKKRLLQQEESYFLLFHRLLDNFMVPHKDAIITPSKSISGVPRSEKQKGEESEEKMTLHGAENQRASLGMRSRKGMRPVSAMEIHSLILSQQCSSGFLDAWQSLKSLKGIP